METGTKMHMKEWLIAQIESGKYAGLSWENEEKTMFRIPWKHAAKKDYSQTADAALFKVRTFPLNPDLNPVLMKSFCEQIRRLLRIICRAGAVWPPAAVQGERPGARVKYTYFQLTH